MDDLDCRAVVMVAESSRCGHRWRDGWRVERADAWRRCSVGDPFDDNIGAEVLTAGIPTHCDATAGGPTGGWAKVQKPCSVDRAGGRIYACTGFPLLMLGGVAWAYADH